MLNRWNLIKIKKEHYEMNYFESSIQVLLFYFYVFATVKCFLAIFNKNIEFIKL